MTNNINSLIDSIKMIYFMNIKDNDSYTTIFMLFLITSLSLLLNNDSFYNKLENSFETLKFIGFKRPNKIIIEGKRCLKLTSYMTKTDNLFSDRFLAFWNYIAIHNLDNPTINCLKEYANSSNIYDEDGEPIDNQRSKRRKSNTDIFVVNQRRQFKLTSNILCTVDIIIDKS